MAQLMRRVCVFSPAAFISTALLLCRPNSQAADFVLGFQLVIWLSTSVTGRDPDRGRVPVTCLGGHWSTEAAGLWGPLGSTNHFRAPQGCVLGPFTFYSQVFRVKVHPKTPTACPCSCSSALLKLQPVENLVFKAPLTTVTNMSTRETLFWGFETPFPAHPTADDYRYTTNPSVYFACTFERVLMIYV